MTQTLEQRLTHAVCAKLSCEVRFVRWIRRATGDIPVFAVSQPYLCAAQALGLTVEPLAVGRDAS